MLGGKHGYVRISYEFCYIALFLTIMHITMTEFMLAYSFNIHIESNEEKRNENITINTSAYSILYI